MSEQQTQRQDPKRDERAKIAQQAHQQASQDMAQFDEETGEVVQSAAAAETPAPVVQEPAAIDKPEPIAQTPEKRIVSIVVDGQKIDVDEDKVREAGIRTLQKESAADRRLAEANEILRKARASKDPEPTSQDPAPSNDVPRDTPATRVDPAALDQMMEQKLYHRDAVRAAQQFKKDYPEIAGDDYLMSLAAQLEDRRLQEATALGEPFGDPAEAYRKHGEEIRKWAQQRGIKAPEQQAASTRTEAKRNIVAVPGVNARAPAPADKKPLSVSDQIEQMRQQRGRRVVKQP